MKSLIKFIAAALFCSLSAHSATINVISRNGLDATASRIIVDSNNDTIGMGYAAIGFFTTKNSTNFATSTGIELENDFTVLGSSTASLTFNGFPGNPFPGIIEFSASAGDPTNIFTGKSAYLVVGNGATLGTSSEALIYLTSLLFGDDLAPPSLLDLSVANPVGNVELGSETANGVLTIGTGFTTPVSNAFQTAVLVPEPSTFLLSAFGLMALLRRKR